eukprot:g56335.t1
MTVRIVTKILDEERRRKITDFPSICCGWEAPLPRLHTAATSIMGSLLPRRPLTSGSILRSLHKACADTLEICDRCSTATNRNESSVTYFYQTCPVLDFTHVLCYKSSPLSLDSSKALRFVREAHVLCYKSSSLSLDLSKALRFARAGLQSRVATANARNRRRPARGRHGAVTGGAMGQNASY